jgi:hypothetical protein
MSPPLCGSARYPNTEPGRVDTFFPSLAPFLIAESASLEDQATGAGTPAGIVKWFGDDADWRNNYYSGPMGRPR